MDGRGQFKSVDNKKKIKKYYCDVCEPIPHLAFMYDGYRFVDCIYQILCRAILQFKLFGQVG